MPPPSRVGEHFIHSLPDTGGLPEETSTSFTGSFARNTGEEEFRVYLPFPHYRDTKLVDRLCRIDVPLAFGCRDEKHPGPEAVGSILCVIAIPIGRHWTRIYDGRIRPMLARLVNHIEGEAIAYHYHQPLTHADGSTTRLIFISDHDHSFVSLQPERIRRGLQLAFELLATSEFSARSPVPQLTLQHHFKDDRYTVLDVQSPRR